MVVVLREFECALAKLYIGVVFSAPALSLLDMYRDQFKNWLRALSVVPTQATEWRMGMNPLECILCQISLARGGADAMQITVDSLKKATKDQIYDYVEILTAIKPRPPAAAAAAAVPKPKADPFFRGRGHGQ